MNNSFKVMRDVILLSLLKRRVLYSSCSAAHPNIYWVETEKSRSDYIQWTCENYRLGNYGPILYTQLDPDFVFDEPPNVFICELTLESHTTLGFIKGGEFYKSETETIYFYE